MSLSARRQAADSAAANLLVQRSRQSTRFGDLLNLADRWRPSILIGGGLVGGFLLGTLQATRVASGAATLASLGMTLMRSPLAALAMSASIGNRKRSTQDSSGTQQSGLDNQDSR